MSAPPDASEPRVLIEDGGAVSGPFRLRGAETAIGAGTEARVRLLPHPHRPPVVIRLLRAPRQPLVALAGPQAAVYKGDRRLAGQGERVETGDVLHVLPGRSLVLVVIPSRAGATEGEALDEALRKSLLEPLAAARAARPEALVQSDEQDARAAIEAARGDRATGRHRAVRPAEESWTRALRALEQRRALREPFLLLLDRERQASIVRAFDAHALASVVALGYPLEAFPAKSDLALLAQLADAVDDTGRFSRTTGGRVAVWATDAVRRLRRAAKDPAPDALSVRVVLDPKRSQERSRARPGQDEPAVRCLRITVKAQQAGRKDALYYLLDLEVRGVERDLVVTNERRRHAAQETGMVVLTCGTCGQRNARGDRHCRGCREPIVDGTIGVAHTFLAGWLAEVSGSCASCSRDVRLGDRYCGGCGRTV